MSDSERESSSIMEQAIAWHMASARDDMDWDGFTQWLEADPLHASAYDEVALLDSLVAEHAPALAADIPAEDSAATDTIASFPRRRLAWRRWAGVGIAASLAAILILPQFTSPSPTIYEAGTKPQDIILADGSSVRLAPHSRLAIEGDGQQSMALTGGAWFDIRHDPSRPLAITAGDVTISDIGTKFDVQAEGQSVRVEVADGEVKVTSATLAQPISLTKGRSLTYDAAAGSALVAPVKSVDVGAWRTGRLAFASVPLALVASDLSRYAGVEVTVPAGIANRRFSGSLFVDDGEAALQDLAQLMDLVVVRSDAGYRLEQRR